MICFVCGSDKVEVQDSFDWHCMIYNTTFCSCPDCGAEWYDDTPKGDRDMNKFEELVKCVEGASKDAMRFYEKGNKAAGVRLRKSLLEIRQLAFDGRKEVTDITNK